MRTLTLSNRDEMFHRFVLPILMSCLLGISSIVKIPLLFTPVAIALQPHLILFMPILLGRNGALIAVLGLFAQALMGLPVLSGGILLPLGPTWGYLLVLLVSPFVVSFLYERLKIESNQLRAFSAMGLCSVLLLTVGSLWLGTYVGMKNAFLFGALPFIIGDILKLTLFSKLVRK